MELASRLEGNKNAMTREEAIEEVSELIRGYVCSIEIENLIVSGLKHHVDRFMKAKPGDAVSDETIRGVRESSNAEDNIRQWTKSKDALNILLNEISC